MFNTAATTNAFQIVNVFQVEQDTFVMLQIITGKFDTNMIVASKSNGNKWRCYGLAYTSPQAWEGGSRSTQVIAIRHNDLPLAGDVLYQVGEYIDEGK